MILWLLSFCGGATEIQFAGVNKHQIRSKYLIKCSPSNAQPGAFQYVVRRISLMTHQSNHFKKNQGEKVPSISRDNFPSIYMTLCLAFPIQADAHSFPKLNASEFPNSYLGCLELIKACNLRSKISPLQLASLPDF